MLRGDFFIVMLLIQTFVGRGVDGERVTGVLHGQVELRGRFGQSPDVDRVEWAKYTAKNSTWTLIYLVKKPNNITHTIRCQNTDFNLQNMSLILAHLTPEDDGIYQEKTTFKNNTIKHFNFTLSLLFASKITVSSSPGSLSLKCEITGEFKLLHWFRDGHPLPDDQRFSLTENTTTLQMFNLTSSDCTSYTCQVSNENGKSEAQVNLSGNISDYCPGKHSSVSDFTKHILFPVGLSLVSLLVLCIILICICIYYGSGKRKTTSKEEPVYIEPTSLPEEAVSPTVDPLLVVYQDFIMPKDTDQSEDFGYSTIADVLESVQSSQPHVHQATGVNHEQVEDQLPSSV